MTDPDVFEHADRNDPVELPVDVPIILQQKSGALAQSLFRSPLVGNGMLLLRQRHAGDIGAAELGEIEPKTAPAAPHVEHALIAPKPQLRGDVPFLGELCIVEGGVRVFEIGAAVLPVGIEEERIETAVEIVMMRDVAAGSLARIELGEAAAGVSQQPLCSGPFGGFHTLTEQDGEHIGNRALFDHQGTIHIGFAEFELGVAQQT